MLIIAGIASAEDLKTFKATFDKEMEVIILTHGMRMTELAQQYTVSLDAVLANVKKAGDLDKTTAVMNEIERFRKEQAMPVSPSALPDIQHLQAAYNKKAIMHETEEARSIVLLAARYDKALEGLQRRLVVSDKLDQARAVQNERKQVKTSAHYLTAKEMVASTSKPTPVQSKPKPKGDPSWISREATYTVSSVFEGFKPLPSLLSYEGALHLPEKSWDGFAFHTKGERGTHIRIDLGKPMLVQRIEVWNRLNQNNWYAAEGIGVWLSIGKTAIGKPIWKAREAKRLYTIELPEPLRARYIKIGHEKTGSLHLAHVKVFGWSE